MNMENCVSKSITAIKSYGEVHLNSYIITAGMLKNELSKLDIKFRCTSLDKWNHIFEITVDVSDQVKDINQVIKGK